MPRDTHFSNVQLLLHGDGSFADTSPALQMIGVASGTPTFSTAITKFGTAAMDFRRTGALSVPSGMDFGVGDFTVEMWIYWNTASGVSQWGAFQLSTESGYSTNNLNLACLANTGSMYAFYAGSALTTTSAIVTGTWQHLAISRAEGVLRAFVDGSKILESSNSFNFTGAAGVVGGYYSSAYNGDVLIDDLRVTKGVGRYTADFIPPSEAFPDAAGTYALSGNVKDSAGANAARVVRAYRESTGGLVGSTTSDATTGNFTIASSENDAHTLVAYPASGENLPALTLRGVVPV